jgi:hypothetical protein
MTCDSSCELIALLSRVDEVNHIMTLLNDSVSTRSMKKRHTASCRKWQLVMLCILNIGPLFRVKLIQAILHAVLQKTNSEFPTPLRSLILMNRPSPSEVTCLTSSDDIVWVETQCQVRVSCLCLYVESYHALHRSEGCILHYFTLLQHGGRMYLNSSYKSDYVCVSQYTTEISRRVLDEFCVAIRTPVTSEREIATFFEAFFIPSRLTQTYTSCETERNQPQTSEQCACSEIEVYTRNLYPIAVGQFGNYSGHLKTVIQTIVEHSQLL